MPILKKLGRAVLVSFALVGLVACEQESLAYRHIKDLPLSKWESYSLTLPVEERLNLQKEIMERSGHNPQMTIEGAFSKQPDETYKAIVRRLKNNDRSRYYLSVLYEINRSPNFKICSQPDRKIVQTYLLTVVDYPEGGRFHPDFYSC